MVAAVAVPDSLEALLAEVDDLAASDVPLSAFDDLIEKRKLETRLPDYIRAAWDIVEPGTSYRHNWHIDLMAEYLEAVSAGEITRLVINIPPRHMKSGCVTVMWPTWEWTTSPSLRWMFASYSQTLSTKHSLDRRTIIESPWYQERWGDRVRLAKDANLKTEFDNTARGRMLATSFGGASTGLGGNRLVVDDPMNPIEAESKTQRESALEFFDKTLSSRLDQPAEDVIVIVMQRLHVKDLTGHVAERGFEHVAIPTEAERRTVIAFPRSGREIVRVEGDLLWPDRFPASVIADAKIALGPFGFAGQHQQKPIPAGGGILKRDWWRFYDWRKRRAIRLIADEVIVFADTAGKKGERNDWSVFGVWARVVEGGHEIEPGFYLLNLYRQRREFPELLKDALRWHQAWEPYKWVIEDASSGTSLAQAMQRKLIPVELYRPDKDKEARTRSVTGFPSSGLVFLPDPETPGHASQLEWVDRPVDGFIQEAEDFPNGEHDDQVDVAVMPLLYWEINPPKRGVPGIVAGGKTRGWYTQQ